MKKTKVRNYFENLAFNHTDKVFNASDVLPFEIDLMNMYRDFLYMILGVHCDCMRLYEKTQNSNTCGDSPVEVENLD